MFLFIYRKHKLYRKKKNLPTILALSRNWALNRLLFASRLALLNWSFPTVRWEIDGIQVMKSHPWLHYSKLENPRRCGPCSQVFRDIILDQRAFFRHALFTERQSYGGLVRAIRPKISLVWASLVDLKHRYWLVWLVRISIEVHMDKKNVRECQHSRCCKGYI